MEPSARRHGGRSPRPHRALRSTRGRPIASSRSSAWHPDPAERISAVRDFPTTLARGYARRGGGTQPTANQEARTVMRKLALRALLGSVPLMMLAAAAGAAG